MLQYFKYVCFFFFSCGISSLIYDIVLPTKLEQDNLIMGILDCCLQDEFNIDVSSRVNTWLLEIF